MISDIDAGLYRHSRIASSVTYLDRLLLAVFLYHPLAVTTTLRLLREQGMENDAISNFFQKRDALPHSAFWQQCEVAQKQGEPTLRAVLFAS